MSPGSFSAAIVAKLVRQLNRFDWGERSSNLRRVDQATRPGLPALSPRSAKQVLSQLRRKRQFDTMERVADAPIQGGQTMPRSDASSPRR